MQIPVPLTMVHVVRPQRRSIAVGRVPHLVTLHEIHLLRRLVLRHGGEEGVDHGVGLVLSRRARVATVKEARLLEHDPESGVAPVVWRLLRPNLDPEIVVTTLQNARHREVVIPIQADHVGLEEFEG